MRLAQSSMRQKERTRRWLSAAFQTMLLPTVCRPPLARRQQSEEDTFVFLASGFIHTDSCKSAFADAQGPLSTLLRLVVPLVVLHLLQNAVQVVAFRSLQRRELLERIELLHPQQLADGEHVPVVQVSCDWRGKCATQGHG